MYQHDIAAIYNIKRVNEWYLINVSNNIVIMLDLCVSNYHFMYCGELRFSKGGLGIIDSS